MNDRRGVLLLLFDLPTQTGVQRREYRIFIKGLRQNGFYMFQESVYVCLLNNISTATSVRERIEGFAPKEGSIQLLPMSLKTFSSFVAIRGTPFDISFFSDDFLVIST